MEQHIYDLAIIGMGPAGFSASVYASRYGLDNVVIGEIPGGLISKTTEIGNWLGDEKISGYDFAMKAMKHSQSFGAKHIFSKAQSVLKKDSSFEIKVGDEIILAKTLILATGTDHKHLNVPGEKELTGNGVSYCATCDGFFYKDKIAAVVGGGNTALVDATYLGSIASKVYIIYRGNELKAEKHWQDEIAKNPKIEILYNTNVVELKGSQHLEEIILDKEYNGSNVLKADGIFVAIGFIPQNEIAKELGVEIDEEGHIKVDGSQKTSVDGLWAAGDITTGSDRFKQMLTAASEGAVASHSIFEYLHKANGNK